MNIKLTLKQMENYLSKCKEQKDQCQCTMFLDKDMTFLYQCNSQPQTNNLVKEITKQIITNPYEI